MNQGYDGLIDYTDTCQRTSFWICRLSDLHQSVTATITKKPLEETLVKLQSANMLISGCSNRYKNNYNIIWSVL
jgi:hypothetical protein